MDETSVTAALPNLDVQILHREAGDAGREELVIRLTATPSFEAAAHAMLPALAMMPALSLWAQSMQAWTSLAQQAWNPWVAALAPPSDEDGQGPGR